MKKIIILIISFFCIQNYLNAQKIDSISNSSFKMYSIKISTTSYSTNSKITQKAVMINYGNENVYFVDKKTKIFLSDSTCLNNNLTTRIDTILFIHNYISKYFNDGSRMNTSRTKIIKYKNNNPVKARYYCEFTVLGETWKTVLIKNENEILSYSIWTVGKTYIIDFNLSLKYVKCKEKYQRSFWDLFFHIFFGFR